MTEKKPKSARKGRKSATEIRHAEPVVRNAEPVVDERVEPKKRWGEIPEVDLMCARCPHCGSYSHKTTQTRQDECGWLAYMVCKECRKDFKARDMRRKR